MRTHPLLVSWRHVTRPAHAVSLRIHLISGFQYQEHLQVSKRSILSNSSKDSIKTHCDKKYDLILTAVREHIS